MKDYLIYSITNEANGKVYIGQTRCGLDRRKSEHISRSNLGERDHALYQAMREFGVSVFRFDVICNALKPEYLDDLERQFIEEYDSFRNGYNMTLGGDSVSEEGLRKISAALKGRKITWYDKIVVSRKANPNRKKAKEFVAKGSANVNARSYLIRFPDGSEQVVTGLNQFCAAHKLTKKCLFDILEGKQKHHKGFSLLARFNDHPVREYGQAAGNGAYPVALTG